LTLRADLISGSIKAESDGILALAIRPGLGPRQSWRFSGFFEAPWNSASMEGKTCWRECAQGRRFAQASPLCGQGLFCV